jgi:hypothetical protein
MTALELLKVLQEAVDTGYGHAEILFDTEARTFDYHMAAVGKAYLETGFIPERPYISLHEKRYTQDHSCKAWDCTGDNGCINSGKKK